MSTVERRNLLVWVWEIGGRAALRCETQPRDMRWFRGLFEMRTR